MLCTHNSKKQFLEHTDINMVYSTLEDKSGTTIEELSAGRCNYPK